MAEGASYHVLVKQGDALGEVEKALARLAPKEASGLHRHFFVSRANQTVVMATDAGAPIAQLLRAAKGWTEPRDPK